MMSNNKGSSGNQLGNVQDASGMMQLCAEQISGIEAAVHVARSLFKRKETEAVLLLLTPTESLMS